MERIPVDSSNLKSVGYDPEKQILEIEFRSNSIYAYFQVPQYFYDSLLQAPSKGKYHDAYIKHGFRYTKVR